MKSSKSKRKFTIVSRRTPFRGALVRLDVLKVRTPSGRTLERELIRHPGAVIIIPRLPDGRLILVKQFRIAVGREIYEFPAGTLEKGESPYRCAHRELQEETGWKAGRLRKILEFFPTPGISNEKMFLYLADRLTEVESPGLDPDEELEVKGRLRFASPPPARGMKPRAGTAAGPPGKPGAPSAVECMSPRRLKTMISKGKIVDGKTVLGFLYSERATSS